jgi:hypothetical protein
MVQTAEPENARSRGGPGFYETHGPLTEPGEFAGLPADLASQCRFVQGIVLHADWASAYGVADSGLSRETLAVAERMRMAKLTVPAKKTPGTCRDFASACRAGPGALRLCNLFHCQSIRRPLGVRVLERS